MVVVPGDAKRILSRFSFNCISSCNRAYDVVIQRNPFSYEEH